MLNATTTLAFVNGDGTNWHVGDVVRKRRQAKGYTQKALAKRAHVHHNTIVRLEDGDEGVQSRTLKVIAVALGTTVRDLYEAVPHEIDRSVIRDLRYALDDLRRTIERLGLDERAVRELAAICEGLERMIDRLPESAGGSREERQVDTARTGGDRIANEHAKRG